MELMNLDFTANAQTETGNEVKELDNLELSMVGGGMGDVVFH